MSKSASFAKSNMRRGRKNQFRPEQIELYKKLREERPDNNILMEEAIQYTNEQGKHMNAIGDIVDFTKKEFFRINGQIHRSSQVQINKDEEQKLYLELLGWKVTDIEVE